LYLKETLGSSSDLLARFTEAVFQEIDGAESERPRNVCIQSRPRQGKDPLELKIPVRSLAKELDEQLPRGAMSPDLPKGRKRAGWKAALSASLYKASTDLKSVSDDRIAREISGYRELRRRLPEITVSGSPKKKKTV
jgi:hypothetical protein